VLASRTSNGSVKRGLFGFGRKQEFATPVTDASVSSNSAGEANVSSLQANGMLSVPQNTYSPNSGQYVDSASDNDSFHGQDSQVPCTACGGCCDSSCGDGTLITAKWIDCYRNKEE